MQLFAKRHDALPADEPDELRAALRAAQVRLDELRQQETDIGAEIASIIRQCSNQLAAGGRDDAIKLNAKRETVRGLIAEQRAVVDRARMAIQSRTAESLRPEYAELQRRIASKASELLDLLDQEAEYWKEVRRRGADNRRELRRNDGGVPFRRLLTDVARTAGQY